MATKSESTASALLPPAGGRETPSFVLKGQSRLTRNKEINNDELSELLNESMQLSVQYLWFQSILESASS